ncbi:MerR family transcriptional regulator [Saccharicrinis fermentans]|uniref:HTH-type transcriptional repressor YcgE n=1 Tax=Saccharicrinis fermentans DSM 9555 = JCM 21142 TaxID=869213 RepID=W7Y8L2_9BACT|nr:MerR family transcriptional regulator [Saccharicrinis fermentans]GAF04562.1 HTH-type transcriptional repressor YcgE [Saccharicrinis fermentans DSM 9555 = JCM 21142]
MAIYSIKDLEKISGIKAHTIRIWERRYGVIEPMRSNTNIRKYSDDDLKRILNISILNQNGFKISKIANLDNHQLKEKVIDLCLDHGNTNIQIESLVVSMLELNEYKFNNVLTTSIIKRGFENTVEEILFPFLDRIGVLWQAGTINPAQEHFISNLIRQKLIVAIDNEMVKEKNAKQITFFLAEDELHEIGLLFYSLLARKAGFRVIYLGVSVPFEDLKAINQIQKADAFFTSFINPSSEGDLEALLKSYKEGLQDTPFLITGLQVKNHGHMIPDGFHLISSASDFRAVLHTL